MTIRMYLQRLRYNWRRFMASRELRPGQFYENCNYHPMVCISNDGGDITGVSLIDGEIRCCDLYHCGVLIFDNMAEARTAVKRYKANPEGYADAVEQERARMES